MPTPTLVRAVSRFARFSPLALVGLAAAACSVSAGPDTGSSSQPVINGKNSDASQNAVVLIVHYDKSSRDGGIEECTGTMLAPNLVLTARHCVARTDEGAMCDTDGKPIGGAGRVYESFDPTNLYVFVGERRPDFGPKVKADGVGAKIVDDGSKTLCNHDIALIELAAPIEGAPIAKIRLDGPPAKGETITSVGWGVTQLTSDPAVRQQRTGVAIIEVGAANSRTNREAAPNEFVVGESICSGDSGGPALASTTGAILGVVSRGGNGKQPTNDPSSTCIKSTNLYTQVLPWADMIRSAYEEVGFEPWYENGPDPRLAKFGEECSGPEACRSNLCFENAGKSTCTSDCTETPCPDGYVCSDKAEARVCVVPPPKPAVQTTTTTTTQGCAAAPGGSGVPGGLGLVAASALASLFVRRRRAR